MKMRRNQKLNTYTLRVRVFRFHIKPILHLLGILWRGEKISGKKTLSQCCWIPSQIIMQSRCLYTISHFIDDQREFTKDTEYVWMAFASVFCPDGVAPFLKFPSSFQQCYPNIQSGATQLY